MSGIVNRLIKHDHLIDQPSFIEDNIHYECITGSTAYGCNDPDKADHDVQAICIPNKTIVFPHTSGVMYGFDEDFKTFNSYQKHNIQIDKKEYDINVFNIVKFFRLAANANPNILDALFVPANCITHITSIGTIIRENRKLFLSKKCWHTCKGFAFSQMANLSSGKKSTSSKRKEDIKAKGLDTKFAYHTVRLLCQAEQILTEGNLDLQRDKEMYKDIRAGNWTVEDIKNWFNIKEKQLEQIYLDSTVVPYEIREEEIKNLLLKCLAMHFGDLSDILNTDISGDKNKQALLEVRKIIDKVL